MYGVVYLANRTNPTIRMHGRHRLSEQTTGRAKEGSMGDMLLVGLTQVRSEHGVDDEGHGLIPRSSTPRTRDHVVYRDIVYEYFSEIKICFIVVHIKTTVDKQIVLTTM